MAIVAITWSLSKSYIIASIVGISKVERVDRAVRAVSFKLTKYEERVIDGIKDPNQTKEHPYKYMPGRYFFNDNM
jgi:aryl-alcohol dehydrogenase-like predicted oxidoreductase